MTFQAGRLGAGQSANCGRSSPYWLRSHDSPILCVNVVGWEEKNYCVWSLGHTVEPHKNLAGSLLAVATAEFEASEKNKTYVQICVVPASASACLCLFWYSISIFARLHRNYSRHCLGVTHSPTAGVAPNQPDSKYWVGR